jgi:hypothetical protein
MDLLKTEYIDVQNLIFRNMKVSILLTLAFLVFVQLSIAAPAPEGNPVADPEAEPTFILGFLVGAAAANRANAGYYRRYGRYGWYGR